jgi:hypothetical protein
VPHRYIRKTQTSGSTPKANAPHTQTQTVTTTESHAQHTHAPAQEGTGSAITVDAETTTQQGGTKRPATEPVSGNRDDRSIHKPPRRSPTEGRTASAIRLTKTLPLSQTAGDTQTGQAPHPRRIFGDPAAVSGTFYTPVPPPLRDQTEDDEMEEPMPNAQPPPAPTPHTQPYSMHSQPRRDRTANQPPTNPRILEPQGETTKLTAEDPEIHAFNASTIFTGMAPNVREVWTARATDDPQGTILIYLARARDYSNTAIALPLLRDTINKMFPATNPEYANQDLAKKRRIFPPIRAAGTGPNPILFLATGLSPDVAHTLVQGKGWSTRELSFFTLPFPPLPFRYVATFTNLHYEEDQKEELEEVMRFRLTQISLIRKAITTGAAEDLDNPDPKTASAAREIIAGEPTAVAGRIKETLAKLTVRFMNLARHDRNGVFYEEPVWVCECPCPCPKDPKQWMNAFEKVVIETPYGNGTRLPQFKCTYCQGIDHPLNACLIPRKDAWFDTAEGPTEGIPGQDAEAPHAPNLDGHEGQRGRGGRGRGNNRGRGGPNARGGRGNARGFA